jgi:hypothetical protein
VTDKQQRKEYGKVERENNRYTDKSKAINNKDITGSQSVGSKRK